jgi:hypothetical protein
LSELPKKRRRSEISALSIGSTYAVGRRKIIQIKLRSNAGAAGIRAAGMFAH